MSNCNHAYLLTQPYNVVAERLSHTTANHISYHDVCNDDFLRQLFLQIVLERKKELRSALRYDGNSYDLKRILNDYYVYALQDVMGANEMAWMLQYASDDILLWFVENVHFAAWPSQKELERYDRKNVYKDPRWIRALQKQMQ